MASDPDYKTILFDLIARLTLADHMGDARNYACDALEDAGVEMPSDVEWEDTGQWLYDQGLLSLDYWRLDDDGE